MEAEAESVVAPIEAESTGGVTAPAGADLCVPPLHSLPTAQVAAGGSAPPQTALAAGGAQRPSYSFKQFASAQGLSSFIAALETADLLTNYVDCCETPLTIFAPSDEAFGRLGPLPEDTQVLRELLCVHITMGCLSHAELLNTRSITTISQQTHHVVMRFDTSPVFVSVLADDGGPARVLQVGSASLLQTDIQLPEGRGVLHTIDSVMCCIRLLQHCRYEQVWNKTVRPSPKVGLTGEWRPRQDELHAILIHCDSWQPRFQGLRGSVIPLGGSGSERSHKSFHDGVVHFSELLILEKPPEMSKKKRKKKDTDDTGTAVGVGTPTNASEVEGHQSSNYRIMFSLYRRFTPGDGSAGSSAIVAPPVDPNAPAGTPTVVPPGKHLTFCMAPDDILIRNSFHMLSEGEKNARRAEYKAASDGSSRKSSGGGRRNSGGGASVTATAVTATATVASLPGGPLPVVTAMYEPTGGTSALPIAQASTTAGAPLSIAMVAGRPMPPPELAALSLSSGPHCGGTSVWVRGRHFCGTTQLYIGGVLAPQLSLVSEGLATFVTPPAAPAAAPAAADGTTSETTPEVLVEVMATNSDLFGGGQQPTFSNALQFTYTASGAAPSAPAGLLVESAPDAQAMERALALLAAHAAPRVSPGDEAYFKAAQLPRSERALFAAIALVLGPRGAKSEQGISPPVDTVPIDLRDGLGRTLLHYAAALKHRPTLELLLRSGADATARDAHGMSPVDLARSVGFAEGDALLSGKTSGACNGVSAIHLSSPDACGTAAMTEPSVVASEISATPVATVSVTALPTAAAPSAPEVGALLTLGSAAPGTV